MDHLACVVPLIDGVMHVESLVTLKTDEIGSKDRRENLRDLSLPYPSPAFNKQRTSELKCKINRRRETTVRDVELVTKKTLEFLDGVDAQLFLLLRSPERLGECSTSEYRREMGSILA